VDHCEIDVAQLDQLWIKLDAIEDVLASKRITSQSLLDTRQDLDMSGVVLVNHGSKRVVLSSESIEEMLGKNPSDISINLFLD
jgi:hypothetical protein